MLFSTGSSGPEIHLESHDILFQPWPYPLESDSSGSLPALDIGIIGSGYGFDRFG